MITGRSKFAKWVNPSAPVSTPTLDVSGVIFDPMTSDSHFEAVLQGVVIKLWDCFMWRTTPQGHDYWYKRAQERVSMSEEDYAFVEAVRQHFYEGGV